MLLAGLEQRQAHNAGIAVTSMRIVGLPEGHGAALLWSWGAGLNVSFLGQDMLKLKSGGM